MGGEIERMAQKERTLDEAITALWQVIDEAKCFLNDPHSTPNDKKVWAKVLGDIISILNKMMTSQKGEPVEENELIKILEKVPEKYARMVMKLFKKQKTKPATSASDKSDEGDIYEQARALKYGEPILITWIDASRSQNVDATKLPLPNHAVETLKEGGPGIFVTVQEGDAYHDPHLVYWTDNLCGISYTIESVPLAVVKKIVKISKEP